MEITLEEAIKQLGTYTIPCGKYKAAYDMAIDTMRKYQELLDYIGAMNMCDEISNEAYRKIMIKFSE